MCRLSRYNRGRDLTATKERRPTRSSDTLTRVTLIALRRI